MRLLSLAAVLLTALLFTGATSDEASAHRSWRSHAPHGYARVTHVRRWVYRPRYRTHSYADPYRYRYVPHGYYPYYNSGYWRPRYKVRYRYRFRHPRYYKAWGDKRRRYRHREWHRRNHGRIPFWLW